ncbi:MarR family winged helix-turn-helix transcriptional regulator [Hymenobacter saemangeumensis]|uniref:MarR family winged helix-turn-helix transcriptional regulator n=1 Tax=Hymenobacter saemangeumensis TaxID=1084522 RepID=A0ABP8IKL7_9BACT
MGNTLNRNFQAEGFDVTGEQWIILLNLFGQDGQTQQELADASYKNKASITSILDTMERKGLLRRQSHATDGRSNLIFLTETARQLQQPLVRVAQATITQLTAGISPEQISTANTVLQQLIKNSLA